MRKYTLEFKEEAVKLVTKGYTQAEAGKALGVSAKIISRWVCEKKQSTNTEKSLAATEQQSLKKLKKENERLRMEHEILKKAVAFFVKKKI